MEIKMATLTLLQHVSSNKVHKVKVDEKVKGSCVRCHTAVTSSVFLSVK